MKYLFINSVCGIRSTGRICTDLARQLEAEGHTCKIAYGRVEEVPEAYRKYAVRIGGDLDLKVHALQTRLWDTHGFGSRQATARFLRWAEEYAPDVLWLHNIHGYYIQVEMLFDWIKRHPNMQVKWTLHDCWAFTGHCAHFTAVGCDQWKTECRHCPQLRQYPACYGFSDVRRNFERKKQAFTGVQHMTLIVPSHWLESRVKQSFLGAYPIEVHYNRINTEVFKPTPGDFRQRYGLQDKVMVLGVATAWSNRKGLDVFVRLAGMLDDRYAIVLVGLTKKQIQQLPPQILGIEQTSDVKELASIYTTADVFVNASVEETFGLTTVEALSCGTPVIVYEDTACAEVVQHTKGKIVPQNVEAVYRAILASGKKTAQGS
ncbi:glycosyltransferase [Subdoligranulum variabile]|uniref:Glycosyltransferase, group 1 family protein n=1 Tax=Subdoligranulum variabile DSM 15176 TaxID=411471 RepID=D1PQ79_9FIRM|nr:glycosyltransferase [Subdoligranulum variabile]EFB75132.1 glycosyltransferase, group 1 family protein [Subdoligranulum variabile DSM 15176]UWP66929.1 glycosyltransferase [Subdoligranulum variabile]